MEIQETQQKMGYIQIWDLYENRHKGWECLHCGVIKKSGEAMYNHIYEKHFEKVAHLFTEEGKK